MGQTHNKRKVELFNLKNIEGQKKFKELTNKHGLFSNIFEDKSKDVNSLTNKFLKKLDKCLHQCFTKIRVTSKENEKPNDLFEKRRLLRIRSSKDEGAKIELESIEEDLADLVAEENYLKIKEEIKDKDSDEGGMNTGKLWKLKKKIIPRQQEPPTAMVDSTGNLVTSSEGIKNIATEHYGKILENRDIKDDLKDVQKDKEELFKHRLDLAKKNKTHPWDIQDLKEVLKYLKNNKSRDPQGNANEIFKSKVAGDDLKLAI